MLQFREKYAGIPIDFVAAKHGIIYKSGTTLCHLETGNKRSELVTLDTPFVIERIVGEEICIRDKDSLQLIDALSGNILKKIPLFPGPKQLLEISSDAAWLRSENEKGIPFLRKIDTTGSTCWQIENVNLYKVLRYKDIILLYLPWEHTMIACDDNNGTELWRLDLQTYLDVQSLVCYPDLLRFDNKLYLMLSGENTGGVYCFDITTGKQLQFYPDCFGFMASDDRRIYTSRFENIFCTIDPFTDQLGEWQADQQVRTSGFISISDHRCVATSETVYFTQTLGDIRAKIGAADLQQKHIAGTFEFELSDGGIASVRQVNETILVHMQDTTLYIFDR